MPRIVAGKARGRQIKSPPGNVRPATARVRKALFDYLSGFIPEARVLDLYCGSGGLGLEALSRGAAIAWFVDKATRLIRIAEENALNISLRQQSRFVCMDVFRFLGKREEFTYEKFDLIFAAPPYKIAEPERILQVIAKTNTIDEGGAVCLEYSRHTVYPESDRFSLARRKIYGETVVDVWDYKE